MTPYDLEEKARSMKAAVEKGMSHQRAIYVLLLALVQHAADKEAEHNLAKPAASEKGESSK